MIWIIKLLFVCSIYGHQPIGIPMDLSRPIVWEGTINGTWVRYGVYACNRCHTMYWAMQDYYGNNAEFK